MNQDTASEVHTDHDHDGEEFETAADHHRMAAHHFTAAAKHHLAAAEADDEGKDEENARHAYLAYRHQLNGVQYAEIAVMDSETLEDALEGEDDGEDEGEAKN
jgi:hypothetical protein